jgi:hypothetical protein
MAENAQQLQGEQHEIELSFPYSIRRFTSASIA